MLCILFKLSHQVCGVFIHYTNFVVSSVITPNFAVSLVITPYFVVSSVITPTLWCLQSSTPTFVVSSVINTKLWGVFDHVHAFHIRFIKMLYFLVSAIVRILFPVLVDPLTYQTSFEKKICQVDGDFLDILILVLVSPRRKKSVMVTSLSLLMVITTVSTGDDPSQPAPGWFHYHL